MRQIFVWGVCVVSNPGGVVSMIIVTYKELDVVASKESVWVAKYTNVFCFATYYSKY